MDKESFLKLLSGPEMPEGSDERELAAVTGRFPYFQTARLLYAQSLRAKKSMLSDEALKVAAAYAGNRKMLYDRLHAHREEIAPLPPKAPDVIRVMETPVVPAADKASPSDVPDQRRLPGRKKTGRRKTVPARHSFTAWLQVVEKKTAPPPKSSGPEKPRAPADPDDLIGRFLRREPHTTPKADFFSPESMAKKSLAEHDEFLTETLAHIYAGQGNIRKAVDICERLGLKYPEKSAYFASLVEKFKAQEGQ